MKEPPSDPISFLVPCNWDESLITIAAKYPTSSLYGKLRHDLIGGGRAPYRLADITRERAAEYIQEVLRHGIDFDYLLNTSCMSNLEFSPDFRRKLFTLLEWIQSTGARSVTVALPFLAKIVQHNFPDLRINVSKMAKVSTLSKAKFWEELGATSANLDHNLIRNFDQIRHIVEGSNLRFHILVNDSCLYHCPWDAYHNIMESHASMDTRSLYVSYCTFSCRRIFCATPSAIIKSMFIRPEDLPVYAALGVRRFKLVDRLKPTDWIANVLRAYHRRRYDGNLADLFPLFSKWGIESSLRPLDDKDVNSINRIQQLRASNAFMWRVFIDNRKLDGFLDHFKSRKCDYLVCGKACSYCESVAEKVIEVDDAERQVALGNFDRVLRRLHSLT